MTPNDEYKLKLKLRIERLELERDALQARVDEFEVTHTDKADAWNVMAKKNEIIATARNDALDEVADVLSAELILIPDNIEETRLKYAEGFNAALTEALETILALKTKATT
jgi:hypothetical protein